MTEVVTLICLSEYKDGSWTLLQKQPDVEEAAIASLTSEEAGYLIRVLDEAVASLSSKREVEAWKDSLATPPQGWGNKK